MNEAMNQQSHAPRNESGEGSGQMNRTAMPNVTAANGLNAATAGTVASTSQIPTTAATTTVSQPGTAQQSTTTKALTNHTITFTPTEYMTLLSHASWSYESTLLLCDIASKFNVIWPVIHDRIQTHAPWRIQLGSFSLIDLKERYYTIGQRLIEHRITQALNTGALGRQEYQRILNEHTLFKHAYDATKERERLTQLEKIYKLSLPLKLELSEIEDKLRTIQRLKHERELQKERRKESNLRVSAWIADQEQNVKIEYSKEGSADDSTTLTAPDTTPEPISPLPPPQEITLSTERTDAFHVAPFIDRIIQQPPSAAVYARSAVIQGLPLDPSTPNDMPHKIRDELELSGLDTCCFLNEPIDPGQHDRDEPMQVFTARIHDEFEMLRIRTQYLVLLKEHLRELDEKQRNRREQAHQKRQKVGEGE